MISKGIMRGLEQIVFITSYRFEMTQILRMEIADILTILRISQDIYY